MARQSIDEQKARRQEKLGRCFDPVKKTRFLLRSVLAIVLAVLILTPSVQAGVEEVYVRKGFYDQVIVERQNGEYWLLKFLGWIKIWNYQNKKVLVKSPGSFGGDGSQISVTDDDETGWITDAERLRYW